MFAVVTVADGGKLGADLPGFWRAELGEQGEGVLPVAPGLGEVTVSVAGLAEPVVRAGLLVLVAALRGQAERGA
jgi:hypothetical protein